MERILKIKTHSQPDVTDQYPSERRYSASIVLGLGLIQVQFSLFSILIGSLIVHKIAILSDIQNSSTTEKTRLERRLDIIDRNYFHYYINIPQTIAVVCYLAACGHLVAFASAIVAWKRWYIDRNITIYFLSCLLATVISAIALLISTITASNVTDSDNDELTPLSMSLTANVIAVALAGMIWSGIATKVAYKGMRSSYPDEILDTKNGRIEVKTICKGNLPQEIINNIGGYNGAKLDSIGYQVRVEQYLNAHNQQQFTNTM